MKYEILKSISLDEYSYQSFRKKEQTLKAEFCDKFGELEKIVENYEYFSAKYYNFERSTITIGKSNEISLIEKKNIRNILEKFIPWRKGPFNIFGIDVHSEWNSYIKWNHILPFIENLEDKVVCDIGCNNGYYLFKMHAHSPKYIIGIDPVYKYYLNFHFLKSFCDIQNIFFYNTGFQELIYLKPVFDVVFCMGIIYHHPNPMEILKYIKHCLKKGGKLILESMVIVDDRPIALFPGKTYGLSRGFWFIPSVHCLLEWLKKNGFRKISVHYNLKLNRQEQQKTQWAPYFSFIEDGCLENTTKEGYPLPNRVCITCYK